MEKKIYFQIFIRFSYILFTHVLFVKGHANKCEIHV